MKKAVEIFVGIDISKAWLDVAVHEQDEMFRAGNNDAGIANLVKWLKELKPERIVWNPLVVSRCWWWQS